MFARLSARRLARVEADALVAVCGNPNAGKTAVFNRLTGMSQKVGNYPGVTVERKEGVCRLERAALRMVDLPGTYSLAAQSPDEQVAVDVLLGRQRGERRPDLILQVVDASNLDRNLYLLSQILETGLPVVVALNMMDVAAFRGIRIDVARLEARLGVPVVPVEGHRGAGFAELRAALEKASLDARRPDRPEGPPLPVERFRPQIDRLRLEISGDPPTLPPALDAVEILRALVDRGGRAEGRLVEVAGERIRGPLDAARSSVAARVPLAALEAGLRYAWARDRLEGCVQRSSTDRAHWSERVDRVLTHRVLGLAIFAGIMIVVFQSIFVGARPFMGWIEAGFGWLQGLLSGLLPDGAFRSLVCDGIIAGVGMVVMFLPQILILFLFIGLLEDFGYMARAAFLMDRVMSKCGLSGKSFVPMLSGFACAVPGILAARVIDDRKDRLATMLVTPLMSCSARLPIYTVFIGTFVPARPVIPGLLDLQGATLFGLYFLGIAVAVVVAWILRKTLLRGSRAPFLLELPSYKIPSARSLVLRLRDRGREFLVRAGTVILAMAVVVWALAYFPRSAKIAADVDAERDRIVAAVSPGDERTAALDRLSVEAAGRYLADSWFGRLGRAVEPVFEPLGWDWRISMSVLASFPAREVFISSLATVFQIEDDGSESLSLRDGLRRATRAAGDGTRAPGAALFTFPVSLSILVFFALCCQCGATVATLARESGSWVWAAFCFAYMTSLAYVLALGAYRLGVAWGGTP